MPMPTVRDVHIEAPLSNISIAYRNEAYIGEQVFPRVPVQKKTDLYFTYPQQAWFGDYVAQRAPGTRAAEADYGVTTASYVAIVYAISKSIADEVRANSDSPLAPDIEAVDFVTDALLRAQEKRIAAKVMAHTGWSYSSSPTTQWTGDTSDPWGDIDTAVNGVVQTIGRQPNVAVMSWDVWRNLRQHPDFLDRIKYTRPGGRLEPSDLNNWFGFQKVLIGNSLYDSAVEGATASYTFIWLDDFWCGYVPNTPSLMAPASGYLLEWKSRSIKRFRREEEYTDVIEASHATAECVSSSESGAIIFDAV